MVLLRYPITNIHVRQLAKSSRPTKIKQVSNSNRKKYAFYDLVLRTPSHPQHPIEANLMTNSELTKLKSHTKTRFYGNYKLDTSISNEDKIAKVFGGRIKGEDRQSSSRMLIGESKIIGGINVPDKPNEPDNCCMSGCINCVWELFDEDIKDWNEKRKLAAKKLIEKGGRWPENFHPPLKYLNRENFPLSLSNKSDKELGIDKKHRHDDENNIIQDDEAWGNVPISIRVFAEVEKKLKQKKKLQQQQQQQQQ